MDAAPLDRAGWRYRRPFPASGPCSVSRATEGRPGVARDQRLDDVAIFAAGEAVEDRAPIAAVPDPERRRPIAILMQRAGTAAVIVAGSVGRRSDLPPFRSARTLPNGKRRANGQSCKPPIDENVRPTEGAAPLVGHGPQASEVQPAVPGAAAELGSELAPGHSHRPRPHRHDGFGGHREKVGDGLGGVVEPTRCFHRFDASAHPPSRRHETLLPQLGYCMPDRLTTYLVNSRKLDLTRQQRPDWEPAALDAVDELAGKLEIQGVVDFLSSAWGLQGGRLPSGGLFRLGALAFGRDNVSVLPDENPGLRRDVAVLVLISLPSE